MITDAVLVVDKPTGITSFDVVRKVRRAARTREVGHGGTLDPLASGVLPICLGEATKLAQFLLDADKGYDVTVRLGVETDTDDADGAVIGRADATAVDEASLRAALAGFRGPQQQVPPIYSALKRDGRPLYAYARAGEPVAPPAPRAVVIHTLDLVGFGGPDDVRLAVRCSKGTYIRALARDLGRVLGVGAHVTALRRTRSGPFALDDAQPLQGVLDTLVAGQGTLPALSLAAALGHLDQCTVGDEIARELRMGRKISWQGITGRPPEVNVRLSLLDGEGELIAVAEPRPDGTVKTLRVFRSVRSGSSPNNSAESSSAGSPETGPPRRSSSEVSA